MEGDPTQSSPVTEAPDASLSAAPEASASPASGPDPGNALMNALIRGERPPDPTSNPDAADDEARDDSATDGEPAPTGDAKPTAQQPGRRARRADEAATRIAALEAERDQLQARVTELAPPAPDPSEERTRQVLADEQRYRRLDAKPDDDPDWDQDDYTWLQAEKRKRAVLPELRQHYETVLDADRRALAGQHEAERADFWTRVAADMASGAELPGVDLAALKQAPSFAARDRLVYAAATATRDAENRALREEVAQLKRDLLGSVRPPLGGGLSSPGRTYDENTLMNRLMRGGRV